ncbi:hypothetical protein ACTWLT_11520 [Micromonospora sp. ZYX-F-536]|uniref:hypothetical protein n=1 Tax=Micromonospora sp. ZYX-F-536 TaxID=3457629 RepID=UPI0040407084
MSLSFLRTVATIAADAGQAVLWGNDVSPGVWRGTFGVFDGSDGRWACGGTASN